MLSQIEIPEYDRFMYLKGYSPEQILQAAHKSMIEQYTEKDDDEITVKVEIKK